jgi:predicted RNA-binding Zn-ribbon protein involved in translation (DUF1610 family)
MFKKSIYCPACNKQYKIKNTDSAKFNCSNCKAVVNPQCQDLSNSYKPPANPVLWPVVPIQAIKPVETVKDYRHSKPVSKPINHPVKTNVITNDSSNTRLKGKFGLWLFLSFILYLLCAFAEFDVNINEWSSLTREIFGVGFLCTRFIALIVDFK